FGRNLDRHLAFQPLGGLHGNLHLVTPRTARMKNRSLRHLFIWCERRDSNSHGLPHWNLNPARLPVPPLSHDRMDAILADGFRGPPAGPAAPKRKTPGAGRAFELVGRVGLEPTTN